jgi:ankyrin repeat protein
MKASFIAPLLVAATVIVTPPAGARDANPAALSVVIDTHKNASGVPTINRDGKFRVVFTNRSEKPIRLWDEDCQPGYETLSFRVEGGNDPPSRMYKRPPRASDWKNNPPKTITIQPGATFARFVTPSAMWADRVWIGTPEPNTGQKPTLTAVFEIKATPAAREQEVWTGLVTSEPIRVLFVDEKLRTPHDYLWADCPKQALKLIQADPIWVRKRDDMQHTPLHLAARFGHAEVAKWLLTHGADVEARAYNEFTPLLYTTHPEIVRLLLEYKADVNAKDVFGSTPLEDAASRYAHCARYPDSADASEKARSVTEILLRAGAEYDIRSACYLGDIDRVRALVKDKARARDKEAMRWAATCGRLDIVKLLLAHGADPEDADYGGLTVSYFSIEHADVLKALFDTGADPRVRVEYHGNGAGPQGSTLLHQAVGHGSLDSAKLLLSRGLDVNLTDASGVTPLEVACRSGHMAMVEWLLRERADAQVHSKRGSTPMSAAVYEVRPGHEEDNARYRAVIRTLERAGVEVDVFAAIACNDVQRIRAILRKNPKAGESKSAAGRPALHQAVTLDCREIVKLLLREGTNPDTRSSEDGTGHQGETPLLTAAFWGRFEIAELLIDRGANVNAKAKEGVVPLHEAARMGHVKLARLLLAHGADVNAKDDKGTTPLDWAGLHEGRPEVTKLLLEHGGVRSQTNSSPGIQ